LDVSQSWKATEEAFNSFLPVPLLIVFKNYIMELKAMLT
jgi:hypothetical protein